MKKLMIILMILCSISFAEIIEGQYTWATTTRNNAIYGAYCDMKFDTQTKNFSYACIGMTLSEFWIMDKNKLRIGRESVSSDNKGYGHITFINGSPYDINGLGRVFDKTSHFMRCEYGYVQASYGSEECISKPDNSKYGAYEGADYGYRCNDGYDDIEGQCIKVCKQNQILTDDVCYNIPKHAYKTAYNNWECENGYEYFIDDEGNNDGCIKSCAETEIRDSITNKCKSLITKNFKKHCKLTQSNETTGDYVTCDKGWDWCKNKTDAVLLPINSKRVDNDCMITECESGYVLNMDYTCIKVDETEN